MKIKMFHVKHRKEGKKMSYYYQGTEQALLDAGFHRGTLSPGDRFYIHGADVGGKIIRVNDKIVGAIWKGKVIPEEHAMDYTVATIRITRTGKIHWATASPEVVQEVLEKITRECGPVIKK